MKFTFYHRVLVLLTALVLLVQLGNMSAILSHIGKDVRDQLRSELAAGSALASQMAQRRSELHQLNAEFFASDSEFHAAIASHDPAKIRTALGKILQRIDADVATFISAAGEQFSNSYVSQDDAQVYQKLQQQAADQGKTADTTVLAGVAKQVVAVPVEASRPMGWLVLGYRLDNEVAQQFSEQVDMHVTFAHKHSNYDFFGSTLSEDQQLALPESISTADQKDYGLISTIDDREHLTEIIPLGSDAMPVVIVLHSSSDKAMLGYYQVRRNLLSYMGLSLVIALALGFWFARGVTRPVKLLARSALHVRQGNYNIALDKSLDAQRGDEIGELINAFGDMQTGIAEREATILHQALFDELTGLPNRRQAQDSLNRLVSEHSASHHTVILLGLNPYRQIVDTLGQAVGDAVIRALSERLQQNVKDAQLLARVSTDEFLLVLPLQPDPELVAYVQALIVDLVSPIVLSHAEMIPDLSAGLVVMPDDAKAAIDAMRRASIALNEARGTHVSVCRYVKGRDESHGKRLSIVADLKRAVEENELVLHYQPKVNMLTGEVDSVEALVRWIHPKHGFMAPDEFISLAECSGYIGMLTQWVLKTTIRQLRQWHDQGITLKIAVNLSALDLQDEFLFSSIEQLLLAHNVPTTRLIIEVTESTMLRDAEQALATLRLMRAHGLTISMDDFGTGYSSLSKLKDLPIDELKIDRAFVTNIEPDTTESHIVKAIVDLGHSVGLTVVAEGVETQAEWDLLAALGNDVVQGYLVSRPLIAEDLATWWQARYPNDSSAKAA